MMTTAELVYNLELLYEISILTSHNAHLLN